MIQIDLLPNRIMIRGHAMAEDGPQWREVCAAVSALTQTAADNLEDRGVKWITRRLAAGDLDLRWMGKARDIKKVLCHGYRHLAQDYPNYIKIWRDMW